ncbi:DUF4214 domain-containing protein [Pigmentiphaga aceris]|nr:DUF4214 domain-containing protein [Pigmentiphaga aceris]
MATPTPEQAAISGLYVALFNRAPDADGFAFWLSALENGASLSAVAQSMMGAPETVALYPAGQTNAQFVTSYYTSVFGRAPDPEGLAFWSAALAAQGGADNVAARASLTMQIGAIASTPLTSKPDGMSDAAYAQTVADRGRFINKTEFGVVFAAELKSNDLALAKSSAALVTADPASLTVANSAASGTPVPAPNPGVAEPAPEPVLVITAADLPVDITGKFAAYAYRSAAVDATGMNAAQLSAVAAASGKIAANGITGSFSLSNTQTAQEIAALLGTKTAIAATVSGHVR